MPPELSRFTSRTPDGWLLEHTAGTMAGAAPSLDGVVLGAGPYGPLRLSYTLECHPSGSVRRIKLNIQYRDQLSEWHLSADGFGHWFDQGVPIAALTGSLDLALWCSPSTLCFPIRRLDLPFGGRHECPVAALPGPDAPLGIWHFRFTHVSGSAEGHVFEVVNLTRDERLHVVMDPEGFVARAGDFARA
jgi:hypothetical protein